MAMPKKYKPKGKGKYASAKQAIYHPKYKAKYKGKYPIQLRSGLEIQFARWVDLNPKCVEWGSESNVVPYFDPVSQKKRRYFIDFYCVFKTRNGLKRFYIEIKPHSQSIPPKKTARKKESTFLNESMTYGTNIAKWKAAEKFAKLKGGEFKVVTEKDLRVL